MIPSEWPYCEWLVGTGCAKVLGNLKNRYNAVVFIFIPMHLCCVYVLMEIKLRLFDIFCFHYRFRKPSTKPIVLDR